MRSLVLALFIFGTIPFIFTRPYLGLLVWSWIGYMNPHRLTYGFAYSFPWVMLIAVVTLIALAISKENKRIPWTTVSVLLLVFFLWTTFTTIFAVMQDDAWGKWDQFAKILVMVAVTLMLVQDRKRMHWLVWLIVLSIGFYGVKGGVFTILKGGNHHVFGPPGSFIGDNNDLAMAFCMILPLMRYLQLQAKRKVVKLGVTAAMLLTGVATLGTYSRGGLIGLAVISAVLFLRSRRRIAVILVLGVVVMTAYHFMPAQWMARMDTLHNPTEVNTLQTRIQSWEFSTNVALHRPLTGGGFDVYKSKSMWAAYGPDGANQRAIHSIYFRVVGDQGFPGFFLYIGLLGASLWACSRTRRMSRKLPDEKWAYDLATMLQVSLLGFMSSGAATTSAYFDLTYQLMAMCTLLPLILAARAAGAKLAARDAELSVKTAPQLAAARVRLMERAAR